RHTRAQSATSSNVILATTHVSREMSHSRGTAHGRGVLTEARNPNTSSPGDGDDFHANERTRSEAPSPSDAAGRRPVQGRRGRDPLHREGEVTASAGEELLHP